MKNLGHCLYRTGEFDEAADLLKKSLDLLRKLVPKSDMKISESEISVISCNLL